MDTSSVVPLRRRTTLPKKKPVDSSEDPPKPKKKTQLAPIGTLRKRQTPKVDSPQPKSPRDETPLILDGEEIRREDIPAIAFPEQHEEEGDIQPASPEKVRAIQEDNDLSILEDIYIQQEEPVANIPQEEVLPSPPVVAAEPVPQIKEKSPPPPEIPARKEAPLRKPTRKGKKAPPKKLLPPDFTKMNQTQRIRALVTYRKRFSNLRIAFPGLGVRMLAEDLDPTPTNLANIHEEYDVYMTHVLVSEDVSQNMIILVIVLGGIELFLTKVLGLPASRYVLKQFKLIGKYRALLYELGEERIINSGGSSPPLVRLIYLILLTSIATIGIRLLESTLGKTGADIAENLVYGVLGGGGADAPSDDPTQNMNVFDLNNLLKMAGNFFGGGGNPATAKQETRGPTYDE